MSYRINKTDGTLLTELVDGVIDTSSTDLTLIGKNYKGFGEYFNENFVQLLENFASSNAPSNPMKGQLWYDTSDNRLKLYDGSAFRTAGGPIVSPDQPTQFVTGDLWIDSSDNKLYMWDGSDLTLVGPSYTAGQGKTGLEAKTMVDTSNVQRTVLLMYIGGILAGIYSSVAFIPAGAYAVAPYAVGREIKVGFNPVYPDTFKYYGTATNAENLIDSQGTSFSATDFVRTNERDSSNDPVEQATIGNLFVKGDDGLKIGVGDTDYARFKVQDGTTIASIETQITNNDFAINVKQGTDTVSAIKVDTSLSAVGIFNPNPTTNLDVTGNGKFSGNVTIQGDLTVEGDASYFNVSTLRVEDPNIELGLLDDSTEGDDSNADGGGITLRSTNGSKDIHWKQTTNAWTANQHFDLVNGKEYRIGNTQVLTKTSIGTSVTSALGLTQIGTLSSLSIINDLTLTGNIVNAGAMSITTGDTITLNSVRLTGLDTPTDASDATTKAYVDNAVATIPTAFSLDITGLTDPNPPGTSNGPITDVRDILTSISPVTSANNGSTAKVHCVSYSNSTVSGIAVSVATDGTGTLQKSSIAVDSNGTQNETVIQDISAANTTSGTFTPSPNRYTMVFEVVAGTWTWQSTSNYT